MWWYIITALVACFIYIFTIKPMDYWKKRNIAYRKPWPLLGNIAPLLFRKKSIVELLRDLYNEFPGKRYSGIYSFTKPQILIRDPELIKQVTIKDFDYFMDHTTQISEDAEPIFSKNLASLHGQKWRDMRATLSPSFTSSKMRFMFTLISDCAKQFTEHFENKGSDIISMEMKDMFSRFTNDVIATVAFGVTVDSLKEQKNEFFLIGKTATNFGILINLKLLGYQIFPTLMKLLKVSVFPKHISKFFRRIVKETIEVRENNGVVRPDMIHLLLETRKGKIDKEDDSSKISDNSFAVVEDYALEKHENHQKKSLSDDDITAQALIFFFAGFETSSTLMSFMSHELAVNPEIQERLQEEIDQTMEACDGKVTYEALLGMTYLDMVVSESLRKWPPGIALERLCVKDYTVEPKLRNEEVLTIEKGMSISIPIVGLHYDSEYFPNPEKFDPERFSEENKLNIVPGSYLPFGVGPRSCIASRFALMETKILFFHLLSKFDVVPIEKTPIPLVLSRKKVVLMPDGGFWLGIQLRKNLVH